MSTQHDFEVEFIEKELVEVNFNIIDSIPPIVTHIDDLEDVELNNVLNRQYLRYNSSTEKWENVTLEIILEENCIFNELPIKINTKRFQTANDYTSGTLQAFLNGIKEYYITEISSNQFEFDIDTEADDMVEISYVRT